MSRHLRVRIALAVLLLLGSASGGYAFAHADVLASLARAQLDPSAVPDLLGPVEESGRTGWECRPEQAASAKAVRDAQLPQAVEP